jgi:uncharacterized membrane protein YeiH
VFSLLGDLFPVSQRSAMAALVQIAVGAGIGGGQVRFCQVSQKCYLLRAEQGHAIYGNAGRLCQCTECSRVACGAEGTAVGAGTCGGQVSCCLFIKRQMQLSEAEQGRAPLIVAGVLSIEHRVPQGFVCCCWGLLVFSLLGDLFPVNNAQRDAALVQIAVGAGIGGGQVRFFWVFLRVLSLRGWTGARYHGNIRRFEY